jgi:hypothetical protein
MNDNASNNATYIQIDLDEPIETGDSVWITAYVSKSSTAEASPYILSGTCIIDDGVSFNNIYSGTLKPNTRGYALTAGANGQKVIKMTRGQKVGTNIYITQLQITRWAEDQPDAINTVKTEATKTANDATYNVSGQRISDNSRGLQIRSGKKYVK